MDIKKINNEINTQVCHKTINMLTDENLLEDYKKSNSVENKVIELNNILQKYCPDSAKQIIDEYIIKIIPAGTKGVIRGNKFNKIIENYINDLKLDNDKFDVKFEKRCEHYETSEIPDWYIYNKELDKTLVGMNQMDLWGGGQQMNRGFKYIVENNKNNNKNKLLCVICKHVDVKNNNTKIYKLFNTGFTNNTLCYINNLGNIIDEFFKI